MIIRNGRYTRLIAKFLARRGLSCNHSKVEKQSLHRMQYMTREEIFKRVESAPSRLKTFSFFLMNICAYHVLAMSPNAGSLHITNLFTHYRWGKRVKVKFPNSVSMLGGIIRRFFGGGDLSAISAHKNRHPFRITYPVKHAWFYPNIPSVPDHTIGPSICSNLLPWVDRSETYSLLRKRHPPHQQCWVKVKR